MVGNGIQGRLCTRCIGAARLRHIRATAAALAAQLIRANAHKINGILAAHQILGDSHHKTGLAIF